MIEFDGLQFNDFISTKIMQSLGEHDAEFAELTHDQIQNRVTKTTFMAAIAKLNGSRSSPKLQNSVMEHCWRNVTPRP